MSHKPASPESYGPVLVWHKRSRRGKLAVFLSSLTVLATGFTVIDVIGGDPPLAWVGFWHAWLLMFGVSLLITKPATYVVLAAGADWFQVSRVRFGVTARSDVLNLYELREVKGSVGGVSFFLELGDGSTSIHLPLHEWQYDRRMWDLVYNGVLHSAAAGAKVNRLARQLLELDDALEEARLGGSTARPEDRSPGHQGTGRELRSRRRSAPTRGPGPVIEVARLSDVDVFRLMQDPGVSAQLTDREGVLSAEQFRQRFPMVPLSALALPPDPAWLTKPEPM